MLAPTGVRDDLRTHPVKGILGISVKVPARHVQQCPDLTAAHGDTVHSDGHVPAGNALPHFSGQAVDHQGLGFRHRAAGLLLPLLLKPPPEGGTGHCQDRARQRQRQRCGNQPCLGNTVSKRCLLLFRHIGYLLSQLLGGMDLLKCLPIDVLHGSLLPQLCFQFLSGPGKPGPNGGGPQAQQLPHLRRCVPFIIIEIQRQAVLGR